MEDTYLSYNTNKIRPLLCLTQIKCLEKQSTAFFFVILLVIGVFMPPRTLLPFGLGFTCNGTPESISIESLFMNLEYSAPVPRPTFVSVTLHKVQLNEVQRGLFIDRGQHFLTSVHVGPPVDTLHFLKAVLPWRYITSNGWPQVFCNPSELDRTDKSSGWAWNDDWSSVQIVHVAIGIQHTTQLRRQRPLLRRNGGNPTSISFLFCS